MPATIDKQQKNPGEKYEQKTLDVKIGEPPKARPTCVDCTKDCPLARSTASNSNCL